MVTGPEPLTNELIADVAQSVFRVWAETAGPGEITRLLEGRPNIPTDIDRILLTDLVARCDRPEIPTWARYTLREVFWAAAEHAH